MDHPAVIPLAGLALATIIGAFGYLVSNWVDRMQTRMKTLEQLHIELSLEHVTRAELERALERIEGRHERALGEVSRRLDQVLIRLPNHTNGVTS
jgi:hypothetical protein